MRNFPPPARSGSVSYPLYVSGFLRARQSRLVGGQSGDRFYKRCNLQRLSKTLSSFTTPDIKSSVAVSLLICVYYSGTFGSVTPVGTAAKHQSPTAANNSLFRPTSSVSKSSPTTSLIPSAVRKPLPSRSRPSNTCRGQKTQPAVKRQQLHQRCIHTTHIRCGELPCDTYYNTRNPALTESRMLAHNCTASEHQRGSRAGRTSYTFCLEGWKIAHSTTLHTHTYIHTHARAHLVELLLVHVNTSPHRCGDKL